MTTQHIEILQEEANRLLTLEIGILKDMLHTEGVLTDSQAGKVQTFDTVNTPKIIEVLEGEQKKLEGLEMVIAIVGTMKAGKSTTINAIVGTEVLPNRNRPMTAIPTLIEHTPGQTEPVLEFKNQAPIERLVNELRKTLDYSTKKALVEELGQDRDMKELIDFIQSETSYESSYLGADAIFNFLKGLNDLVRLSKELGLEFPFSDYDEIHEIPVIKVEFVHLRETEQAHGKLTLLDTPGPNESGQPHLRKMLKDQLAKASAVLAVLDFTQLKSDADAQVREDLKAIASVSEGRLYALVNKFDNSNRNSDNAEQVKAFVANTLMERSIPESNVFPVSAQNGYLANRIRHELFMNQELPDYKNHPWVEDFGNAAFGKRWQKMILDIEATKEAADDLWADSLFHDPLEQVIKTAQAQAALLAIETATAKLVDTSVKLENFLNARETALTTSTQELNQEITALLRDIARIKEVESTADANAKTTLSKLESEIKISLWNTKTEIASELDRYFKEGKRFEDEAYKAYEASLENRKTRRHRKTRDQDDRSRDLASRQNSPILTDILGGIGNFINNTKDKITSGRDNAEEHFDPKSSIIKFDDANQAHDLLEKINNTAAETIKQAEEDMKESMTRVVAEFQSEFSTGVEAEAKKIIADLEKRLKKGGFEISLASPDIEMLSLDASGSDILTDLIDEKQKTVTRQRRQTGAWGTVCSWFNADDWGWESYQTKEKYFEVDMKKIKQSIDSNIDQVFDGLGQSVTEKIRTPLENSIKEFFLEFTKNVDQIRGDLLAGLRSKEGSKAEQDALTAHLQGLKKNMPAIRIDSKELYSDIRKNIKTNAGEEK
jgi:signal recognition particle receptor subunit beta